jgi:tRNA 2-thiouridine synthesizing protein A
MIETNRKNTAMADISVDARGLSCPEPVLLAKKAIEQLVGGTIEVLVDTATGMENVSRMANTLSCAVEVTNGDNGNFLLSITKE